MSPTRDWLELPGKAQDLRQAVSLQMKHLDLLWMLSICLVCRGFRHSDEDGGHGNMAGQRELTQVSLLQKPALCLLGTPLTRHEEHPCMSR